MLMDESNALSCSSNTTSPDSKFWSDFLSPPNFPTSLLFFLFILLSLSLYPLRCYKSFQQSTPSAPVLLEVEDSSRILPALEVILGGFATFRLERRSRK
jgi:hypothetical protein